jgi:GTP-binding protein EngB required for normal cell division
MKLPEIAIIGHPNEGKSSVLSTLAEDDSVRISPYPGETTVCRSFPVTIDNRELIRFIDTPGFQNPAQVLATLKTLEGSSEERLQQLLDYCGSREELSEDFELLQPVSRGAALIYVVNGARPVRTVDRDEMEIIRLIGKPRMAVINSKGEDERYLPHWKDELAIRFNSIRLFNAHRATYIERIGLLEALGSIDQDWEQVMSEVVESIKTDWDSRTRNTAHIICTLMSRCMGLKISSQVGKGKDEEKTRTELAAVYTQKISKLEKAAHGQIRAQFHHNLYDYKLPPYSVLHEDIFSEKTWEFLGLSKRQFVLLGGIGGGALGIGVDVAALGHGLGLFTALGTIGGALGALGTRKRLDYQSSLLGMRISGPQITIGPADSIALLFVLINRALHFYTHMANWSHGRRDYEAPGDAIEDTAPANYTSDWSASELKIAHDFYKTTDNPESDKHQVAAGKLETVLNESLIKIYSGD